MRYRKPRCYLEKCCTGWFGTDLLFYWIARDLWGHEIARAKTKKICIAEARRYGYVPAD